LHVDYHSYKHPQLFSYHIRPVMLNRILRYGLPCNLFSRIVIYSHNYFSHQC
jgi:hypothetical protein